LEDYRSLIQLHVSLQMWDEAFALSRTRPEIAKVGAGLLLLSLCHA
jgi:hypothetical protein